MTRKNTGEKGASFSTQERERKGGLADISTIVGIDSDDCSFLLDGTCHHGRYWQTMGAREGGLSSVAMVLRHINHY